MIICWSAKGGAGSTVVACALALDRSASSSVTVVDLAGDVTTALGVTEPAGPGIDEWLRSPTSGPEALRRLRTEVAPGLHVLAPGAAGRASIDDGGARLADALTSLDDDVIVDAGTGEPPPALVAAATHALLVTRACFVAMQRAVRMTARPSGIVLVREPERALRPSDVEHAIGVPIVAVVDLDPAVARMADAGMLAGRMPRTFGLALRAVR
ncbi:unnamed protein product [Phaeothamnion confervicola]